MAGTEATGFWDTYEPLTFAAAVRHGASPVLDGIREGFRPRGRYGLLANEFAALKPVCFDADQPAWRWTRALPIGAFGGVLHAQLRLNYIDLDSRRLPAAIAAELFVGPDTDAKLHEEQVLARVSIARDEELRGPDAITDYVARLRAAEHALALYVDAEAFARQAA